MATDFTLTQWLWAIAAAMCSGISKAGLAGVGMIGVVLMTEAIPGRQSTGVVLPLLILADIVAASTFRQHVLWAQIRRLALPVLLGITAGALLLNVIPDSLFRHSVGWIVLGMILLQVTRQAIPNFDARVPHSLVFAWFCGFLTGFATMVANAAGPIATVYLLILALPKNQFVHTMAWLFLIVNLSKVPFSLGLGLITAHSLTLNLCLAPAVLFGLWLGKKLVDRIPQKPFQLIITLLAALSALRLILS